MAHNWEQFYDPRSRTCRVCNKTTFVDWDDWESSKDEECPRQYAACQTRHCGGENV